MRKRESERGRERETARVWGVVGRGERDPSRCAREYGQELLERSKGSSKVKLDVETCQACGRQVRGKRGVVVGIEPAPRHTAAVVIVVAPAHTLHILQY